MMVKTIHLNKGGNSEFSVIISYIKNLLVCNLNFEVKLVKHQANLVAHLLAKTTNSWSKCGSFHLIPHCIEQTLINEMH